MEKINYELILNELLKGIKDPPPGWSFLNNPYSIFIKEYRTIKLTTARQSGLTTFIKEKVNEGSSIAIVYSQKSFLKDCKEEYIKNVFTYKNFCLDTPRQVKGIKFIFVDDHKSLTKDFYYVLLKYFGQDIVVIET